MPLAQNDFVFVKFWTSDEYYKPHLVASQTEIAIMI